MGVHGGEGRRRTLGHEDGDGERDDHTEEELWSVRVSGRDGEGREGEGSGKGKGGLTQKLRGALRNGSAWRIDMRELRTESKFPNCSSE